MAPQSRAPLPAFLLTRPAAQGARFAASLRETFGKDIRIVTAPLLAPVFLRPLLPAGGPRALIFTSETGVEGFQRISAEPGLSGCREAWCVGNRTLAAARQAGLAAYSAEGDAEDLLRAIVASGCRGPLLHLRGADTRGDIANRLTALGILTDEAVVYDQRPHPLTAEARDLLRASGPVLAPLFSPRTACLLAAELLAELPKARLWLAALSPAVAEATGALRPERMEIAARPDAGNMLSAIKALIAAEADA